jgi:hypothetical protein
LPLIVSSATRPCCGVGNLPDVLRPGVEAVAAAVRLDAEAELRGDDDLLAEGRERLTEQLLVRERAVGLGRVEERDAALDGSADNGNGILPVGGGAVGRAQAHRSITERRDFEVARPQRARLHA